MKRSDIAVMPEFFDRYILLMEDEDIILSLTKSLSDLKNINSKELESLGNKTYAPGKWTIKDIIQHMIDTERIQAYRAMRIARNDKTTLPGFEENLFADNTNAIERTVQDLIDEFKLVRKSNILLFKNFTNEMLQRKAVCFKVEISPLALGFVICGHQKHHLGVVKDKYLPLLQS